MRVAALSLNSGARMDVISQLPEACSEACAGACWPNEHAWLLRRSCRVVERCRAGWYVPPVDWTVRDSAWIAPMGRCGSRLGRLEIVFMAA